MTADPVALVLKRLPSARKAARGWIARCPAHDDRGPSLSIGRGRDDRALLRCFAGCELSDIMHALSLEVRDLFVRNQSPTVRPRLRSGVAPSKETVSQFIISEIEAVQKQRHLEIGCEPPIRTADVNRIRKLTNRRFGTHLKPVDARKHEGYAPHDTDPLWPALFARALEELARELHHSRDPAAQAWETCEPPPFLEPLAADRAARWLHEIAQSQLPNRAPRT